MKTNLSPADIIALTMLDIVSMRIIDLMRTHPEVNHYQLETQEQLGRIKAGIVDCGCQRPSSCGSCRTKVEDEVYWSEKIDDLLDEAKNEIDNLDNQ